MNRRSGIVLVVLSFVFNAALHGAKAYVTNTGNNSVSIFDTTTNAVTGIVQDLSTPTFNSPEQIAITPDGKTAYVANSGGTVSVIDVASDTVTQIVDDPMTTFNSPFGIAITPDGKTAYVTNETGPSVSVINVATNTVTQVVNDPGLTFTHPIGIAITPDGKKAYVANVDSSTVSIIDISLNSVTGIVTDGGGLLNGPTLIAFTPDGTTAYVTNDTDTVCVIKVATDTVTQIVTDTSHFIADTPYGIAFTPNGTKAYVTCVNPFGPGVVAVIDVATNTATSDVSNPNFNRPHGIVFTQDGANAYVANNIFVGVSIIDVASDTVASPGTVTDKTPATFQDPSFIAIVPSATPPTPTQSITLSGVQKRNVFLTQTDYINIISWTTPTNVTPVSYTLYRDAALTTVVGTVAVGEPLFFADHNRNPTSSYTYYLVAVDQAGNKTLLGNVTVRGLQQIG